MENSWVSAGSVLDANAHAMKGLTGLTCIMLFQIMKCGVTSIKYRVFKY